MATGSQEAQPDTFEKILAKIFRPDQRQNPKTNKINLLGNKTTTSCIFILATNYCHWITTMKNNSRTNDAILGLMRVSKFGEVAGEDIVSGLEDCRERWKAIVPGSNIGTEHQTKNAANGRLFFDELRILTSKTDYLDLYEMALVWRPSFVGVGFVEDGDVELVMIWES